MLPPEETASLKWGPADEEGVVAFLVGEKNFNEDRVRKTVQKINASRSKATQGAQVSLLFMLLLAQRWRSA